LRFHAGFGRDVPRISKAAPKLQSIALAGSEMEDATPFATDAEGVWINPATRCGMSDSGRAYSYLRSISLVSLDALGAPEQGLVITSISGALLLFERLPERSVSHATAATAPAYRANRADVYLPARSSVPMAAVGFWLMINCGVGH
jgi:hypothetical protein